MKKIFLITILSAVAFWSCDDYLNEEPSKSTAVEVESFKDLERLFNNYSDFYEEPSYERSYGTDDFELSPVMQDSLSNGISANAAQQATWDVEYTPNEQRQFWPNEWYKIFIANMVLENLPEVEGGSEKERDNLEAEANFILAYSYFNLATVYCLPYNESNLDEMGLPLKSSTSFEESLERSSLSETYEFIEEKLNEALSLERDFSEVNGKKRSWRASTASVNAFAARYYLVMNDYEKAETYASNSLNEYDFLRDYNSEMYYSDIPAEVTIFDPEPITVELNYPYTYDLQSDPTDRMEWGEIYYYRFLANAGWNFWPSQELLGLYNKEYDLRYKYHMVEGYSYEQGSAIDPPFNYPGYIFFYKDQIPSGPTVPEMFLTKAEAQIRQGNWENGIETVQPLREARVDKNAPLKNIKLQASSQEEALSEVIKERRREMPFVHRWMDIRRYNNNETSIDDVEITRYFYPYSSSSIQGNGEVIEYTLEKDSRLFARPIPESEIISSEGVLKQNTY